MRKILIIILIAGLFTACDEKEVRLYPTIEVSADRVINQEGEFEAFTVYSAQEINDLINDISSEYDGEIEDVSVEKAWLVVTPLANNTANSVTMDALIWSDNQSVYYLIEDYEFTIPSNTRKYMLPNYLKKEGVLELQNQLDAIIVDKTKVDDIEISFKGEPSPANSVIHLELKLFVEGSVVVKQIVEML